MSYHKKTFPFRATDSIAINLPTSSTGLGVFEPKRSNVLRISSVDMFLSSSEWLSISSGFQACFTVFHSSINPQCRRAGPSINFCWKTEDTAGSQSLTKLYVLARLSIFSKEINFLVLRSQDDKFQPGKSTESKSVLLYFWSRMLYSIIFFRLFRLFNLGDRQLCFDANNNRGGNLLNLTLEKN